MYCFILLVHLPSFLLSLPLGFLFFISCFWLFALLIDLKNNLVRGCVDSFYWLVGCLVGCAEQPERSQWRRFFLYERRMKSTFSFVLR